MLEHLLLSASVLYVVSNASLGLRVAGACSQSEAYYALSDKCHLTMFSKCLLYSRRYDRKILALVPCRDTSLFKRTTTQLLKKVVKTFDGKRTLRHCVQYSGERFTMFTKMTTTNLILLAVS